MRRHRCQQSERDDPVLSVQVHARIVPHGGASRRPPAIVPARVADAGEARGSAGLQRHVAWVAGSAPRHRSIRSAGPSSTRAPTPSAERLPRGHRCRCPRRPARARRASRTDASGLRDRRRAGLVRDTREDARLRSSRPLRLRPCRRRGLDGRDRRARSAHRLDVQGRLARPPERVDLHAGGRSSSTR